MASGSTIQPSITPELRVGELLDAYPQLEEVLVAFAPPFQKLRNPVLRKTVARFTTLSAAARVAGVALPELIKTLRAAVGQPVELASPTCSESVPMPGAELPVWASNAVVGATIDADELLASGEHPLGPVLSALSRLPAGQVLCLRSSFAPAPLVDYVRQKGYETFTAEEGPGRFRTWLRATGGAKQACTGGCCGHAV